LYSSIKTVGATVLGGLWALEWMWHIAEKNVRCVRSLGICTPNLNSLALIVSEISAFIRTDRQTDRRIDSASDPDQECMYFPFKTDIKGEINLIDDRPIYGKQYPYALSVTDIVNSEISRILAEKIIRPCRSPYNSPVRVVPKKGENQDRSRKLGLVIDLKKIK